MSQLPRFTEVADRVWVARYEWYDVNVSVVEGADGLLVVDTHASSTAAREVIRDLRRLSDRPLVGIVNTHVHVDHVFGNAAFREAYGPVPITAHENAANAMVESGEAAKQTALVERRERAEEIAETSVVPADHTFSSVTTLDLGDRLVELVHPGPGHTDGDLVVRLEDAGVLLAGDLVEESGSPSYGSDSFPMDWPLTLDLVLGLIGSDDVVVPGHGTPVTKDFVEEQRAAIGVVAETIRDLASRGVPVEDALAATQWPYPVELLGDAVRRGYAHLPRSQKRLPLL